MPRPRGRALVFDPEIIRSTFAAAAGKSRAARVRATCAALDCSPGTVQRALKDRVGTALSHSPGGPSPLVGRRRHVMAMDNAAVLNGRTLFPTMVFDVRDDEWALKSAENSAKIGREVAKGPWRGFPIYTLTLEERATCPVSCRHWVSCYGNHSPYARRWRPGAQLEWRLAREVAALELRHRAGFAVRLHNLGDFYSVGYVEMWRGLLERHAALRVFGYTARHDTSEDEIAYRLALLVRDYWLHHDPPRFAVRFSNAPVHVRSTITIESPGQKPRDTTVCPAQWTPSGKKADCCASCGLCWNTDRRIAFLQH